MYLYNFVPSTGPVSHMVSYIICVTVCEHIFITIGKKIINTFSNITKFHCLLNILLILIRFVVPA